MSDRPSLDPRWVPALLVVVAAVGAGVWFGAGTVPAPAPSHSQVPSTVAPDSRLETVSVHVAGWVARPGVVQVAVGARVADAVAAAGGIRRGASPDGVNLAAVVTDGQQVVVPGPGGATAHETLSSDGLVHLNTASPSELESLPGVGPVLAQRIVDHRQAHGPFEVVEDLLEVSGIGESILATLREHVALP